MAEESRRERRGNPLAGLLELGLIIGIAVILLQWFMQSGGIGTKATAATQPGPPVQVTINNTNNNTFAPNMAQAAPGSTIVQGANSNPQALKSLPVTLSSKALTCSKKAEGKPTCSKPVAQIEGDTVVADIDGGTYLLGGKNYIAYRETTTLGIVHGRQPIGGPGATASLEKKSRLIFVFNKGMDGTVELSYQ